jgi:hypothetical protein
MRSTRPANRADQPPGARPGRVPATVHDPDMTRATGRTCGRSPYAADTRHAEMSKTGTRGHVDPDRWVRPPTAERQPPGSRAAPSLYARPAWSPRSRRARSPTVVRSTSTNPGNRDDRARPASCDRLPVDRGTLRDGPPWVGRGAPTSPAATLVQPWRRETSVSRGDGGCQLPVVTAAGDSGSVWRWPARTWMRFACTSGALGTRIRSTPSWAVASIASVMTWLGSVIERRNGP